MNITGIAWLGTPTDRSAEMRRFAIDVLTVSYTHLTLATICSE